MSHQEDRRFLFPRDALHGMFGLGYCIGQVIGIATALTFL